MGDNISLDSEFAETQDVVVKSHRDMYRYRKRFKAGTVSRGRKQGRFHDKTKNLPAGTRRD